MDTWKSFLEARGRDPSRPFSEILNPPETVNRRDKDRRTRGGGHHAAGHVDRIADERVPRARRSNDASDDLSTVHATTN